jgi:hypothetical protein
MPWVFDQFYTDHWPQTCGVLELSSGSGELWQLNASRLKLDWVITLSDFSRAVTYWCHPIRVGRATPPAKALDIQHANGGRCLQAGVFAGRDIPASPDTRGQSDAPR